VRVVCVCGTGRTTPTLVGGRTAAGRCKTGPRPLPQAALNETSSISVIFIYLYCEIHIFNYSSICLRTTPFELLQNHLTRVQRVKRDPTPQKWDLDAERPPRDHETTPRPRDPQEHWDNEEAAKETPTREFERQRPPRQQKGHPSTWRCPKYRSTSSRSSQPP
jgi:hypothetical protein